MWRSAWGLRRNAARLHSGWGDVGRRIGVTGASVRLRWRRGLLGAFRFALQPPLVQQRCVPSLLLVKSVSERVESLIDTTHVVLSIALDATSQPVKDIPASGRQQIPHAIPASCRSLTGSLDTRCTLPVRLSASDRWAEVRQWLLAGLPRRQTGRRWHRARWVRRQAADKLSNYPGRLRLRGGCLRFVEFAHWHIYRP